MYSRCNVSGSPSALSKSLVPAALICVHVRLRSAIIRKDVLLVKRIIKNNPRFLENPNFEDKSNTSLHLAAILGNLEIIKLLVSFGHDSCAPKILETGFDAAPGISLNTDGATALHLAAAHSHAACVQYLCTQFPQTIDRPDHKGITPLMLAAQSSNPSHPTRSTCLIPPKQRPRSSSNAAEDTSTIATLLRQDASVTLTDNVGNTALHYASAWGNLKAFRLLVSAGAPPLALNHAMCTPADYALSVQAGVYFRSLVSEFERLKAESPQLPQQQQKMKLSLKVNDGDLNRSPTGVSTPQRNLSPISPTEMRLASKTGLSASRPGMTTPSLGSVRLITQEDGNDMFPLDPPLTARKVSVPMTSNPIAATGPYAEFRRGSS
ncbi:ankyrin repeat containing protein [Blastomyces dermatitidis ATCC 18188]|uniref:Ankyrin repeat containing protein n=1 Tax=Ajellomyces dermatitidis (strain ATCC 18188 / CBS 674.68) TaxID=653446 RepID=F2T6T6_AJEDA|nr:ankyrin repeat containing protein [Blastomyces dermatitidis ATCC 18188]